jgi:hypothetical protein
VARTEGSRQICTDSRVPAQQLHCHCTVCVQWTVCSLHYFHKCDTSRLFIVASLLYSRAAVLACALLCALGPAQLLETVNHVDRPVPELSDGYSLPGRQPKVLVE